MKKGIKTISVSTIGKIIKRYNLTFNQNRLNYHNPGSNTVLFFKKLESVYPYEEGIEIVQTDNGSEFLKEI